ncbi:hypothetical protein GT204_07740 [Streptomyces sp. SID4919]|uniref:hypothetical protein n=1 Tax=unclassified Streptomyces TaxID=2593676 RepID=UPI000823F61C|nr:MULTISPECIES: hypothetical protein [unclassified Streptomyces]MYY08797.1 hypothetical protein [Streptomyces sp. SID4919]SCK25324.1 hypothetical protein YW7DRAFT_01930 [Streptomyces sp. AmelKG-E11A]
MTTRAEAMRAAARIWRHGMDAMDHMTADAAARVCYQPGGPPRDVLLARIRADRAERRVSHRTAA